ATRTSSVTSSTWRRGSSSQREAVRCSSPPTYAGPSGRFRESGSAACAGAGSRGSTSRSGSARFTGHSFGVTRQEMRRWLLRTLLALALAVASFRVAGQLGGALRSIATAEAGRLAIAAAFEVVSYLFIGSVLRRLARDRGRDVSLGHAFRVGLVAVGLGNILPAAPVEGMLMGARALKDRGIPGRRTFVAVALVQWYCGRALLAVAALTTIGVAVFAGDRASPFHHTWPALLGAAALLALVFLVTGAIAS